MGMDIHILIRTYFQLTHRGKGETLESRRGSRWKGERKKAQSPGARESELSDWILSFSLRFNLT